MTEGEYKALALAAEEERLRQESETFDQRKQQDAQWFRLRLQMGAMATVLLPVLAVGAAVVLVYHDSFPASVVTSAAGVLFVDVAGLIAAVWKVVLNPSSVTRLEPVTAGESIGDESG